jgi:hypothetical protein
MVAVLAGASLVLSRRDTGSPSDAVEIAAAVALAGVGVVWLLVLAERLTKRRPPMGWLLAYPIVTGAAVALAATSANTAPTTQSGQEESPFEQHRAEFEAIAERLLDTPGRTYSGGLEIGPILITNALDNSASEVYFYELPNEGTSLDNNPGWVYSPSGTPRKAAELGLADLGRNWYRFTNVVLD